MSDLFIFLYSSLFIIICISAVYVIHLKLGLSAEVLRKLVHIGVSNWYFFYLKFNSATAPITGLAIAAILIFFCIFYKIPQRFFGAAAKERSWGLLYYPLSIIVLIILVQYNVINKVSLGCGLLSMGYGDGLAAIVGTKWGKMKISKMTGKKSWKGTFTMFVVCFIICFLLKGWSPVLLAVALAGAAIEALSPLGLDNVTVPIGIALLVEFI